MASLLDSVLRPDVAVDLGTALTRIAAGSHELFTIPSLFRSRPALRSGAIADPQGAAEILRPFLSKRRKLGIVRPRAVAAVPSDATAAERQALVTSVLAAGAASARLVPAPLAAALGAGVDVSLPYAQMIVDVGEGVTDCAVVRSGEIVLSRTARVGCGVLREAVRDHLRSRGTPVTVGEAQALLAAAGVASGTNGGVRRLAEAEIHAALGAPLGEILGAAAALLHDAGDGVGCEVIESGIVLTGGGALLPGMRESLAARTSIHVVTPSRPLDAVVLGLRGMLS